MKRLRTLAYLFILASPFLVENTYAIESLPVSVKLKLQELYPGANGFDWKTGLIDSDEIDDLAVLVTVPGTVSRGREALAVFFGEPNRGFRLVAKSLLWSERDRVSSFLTIEKRSVLLNFECSAQCGPESSNGNYQFRESNGKLSLIGESISTYTATDGSYGNSINYLTRKAIFWRKNGKKYKEFETHFPNFSPIYLESFDRWDGNDPRPKETKGYVDDMFNFKYAPY
jgi:hypothetical protein